MVKSNIAKLLYIEIKITLKIILEISRRQEETNKNSLLRY